MTTQPELAALYGVVIVFAGLVYGIAYFHGHKRGYEDALDDRDAKITALERRVDDLLAVVRAKPTTPPQSFGGLND